MSYFPEIGDSVKIMRGRHYGKIAVVKSIDQSTHAPLYVVDIGPDLAFADWLSPYDVEPCNVEPIVSGLPVSETKPAVRRIIGRKIASAATIDSNSPIDWRKAVKRHETYLGYTAWVDAIENGERT